MKTLALTLLFFSHSALATIWVTIADPETHKIAVVGASSGYIGDYRTMVPVDNFGIAVVGSWYLGRHQDELVALMKNEALTASEVAKEFSRLINQDSYKRRVSLVNARFENASEPGRGCHAENHYCGKYEDPLFTVTGGGLVGEQVILAAKDTLHDRNVERLPIECRLYSAISSIFSSGGEIKTFNRLAFVVDDINVNGDNKMNVFFRYGNESSLLKQFKKAIRSRCD
jgi:hypothetical protein